MVNDTYINNNSDPRQSIIEVERHLSVNPHDAVAWYMAGNIYLKLGEHGRALSSYMKAATLDPSGPAPQAVQMLQHIFDFHNPDLLNP